MTPQKDSSYWQFCRKTSLQVPEVLAVGLASVLLLLQATRVGWASWECPRGLLLLVCLEASLLALSLASRKSD